MTPPWSGVRTNAAREDRDAIESLGARADPDFRAELLGRLPVGRLATVPDLAHAVLYLASYAAAVVTGHVLRVDNGWTARHFTEEIAGSDPAGGTTK